MPKFIAHATKTITQKISFSVEADDLDDAYAVAEEELPSYPLELLGRNTSVKLEIEEVIPDLNENT